MITSREAQSCALTVVVSFNYTEKRERATTLLPHLGTCIWQTNVLFIVKLTVQLFSAGGCCTMGAIKRG